LTSGKGLKIFNGDFSEILS